MINADRDSNILGAIEVYNDLVDQYNQLEISYVKPVKTVNRALTMPVIYTKLSILCLKLIEYLENSSEANKEDNLSLNEFELNEDFFNDI